MLDNYVIILGNWIGAILRIRQETSIALLKMVYHVSIVWLNIVLLLMDTTALPNLFQIQKVHIVGLTLDKYALQQM